MAKRPVARAITRCGFDGSQHKVAAQTHRVVEPLAMPHQRRNGGRQGAACAVRVRCCDAFVVEIAGLEIGTQRPALVGIKIRSMHRRGRERRPGKK